MRKRRKKDPAVEAEEAAEVEPAETTGPFDVSEVDPDATYVDLGSLLVQPPEGLDLRLQVDEQSGAVMTVLLVAEEGVLEMRAFASSRGGDLWTEARREIAADTTGAVLSGARDRPGRRVDDAALQGDRAHRSAMVPARDDGRTSGVRCRVRRSVRARSPQPCGTPRQRRDGARRGPSFAGTASSHPDRGIGSRPWG
jgi:hypothetical protein